MSIDELSTRIDALDERVSTLERILQVERPEYKLPDDDFSAEWNALDEIPSAISVPLTDGEATDADDAPISEGDFPSAA